MNVSDLLQRIAEVSLSEGRPLAAALEASSAPVARSARVDAASGRLDAALTRLGLPPELRRLAASWPKAVRPAAQRLRRLPSLWMLRLPLLEATAYFTLVALVQGTVFAVLSVKVFPVLFRIGADHGVPSPDLAEPAGAVFLLLLLPFLAVSAVFGTGLRFVPGAARHLARARQASVLAALCETGAPTEVLASALKSAFRFTRSSVDTGVAEPRFGAADFDAVAVEAAAQAELSAARFASLFRAIGYSLLVLFAFGILAHVIVAVGALGGFG